MATENTETFTPDEIAAFEALSDDDQKQVERFLKWRGLKANPGQNSTPPGATGAAGLSQSSELSLSQLKKLAMDPEVKSILQNWWAQAEALANDPKNKKTATPSKPSAFGNLIKRQTT